jgi:hypothetical protein
MEKTQSTLSNENGSVLVIALIMLALLTTLGIMSTNTTTIDLQIAQNERLYSDYFNRAEAAAMHAMQIVADERDEDGPVDLTDHDNIAWLHNAVVEDFRDPANWVYPTLPNDATLGTHNSETLNLDNTRFAVVDTIMQGQSEEEGAPNLIHVFHCFGLYRPDPGDDSRANRGEILVEVGFRRRI